MILPNVRSSFGDDEVTWLLDVLGGGDPERRRAWEDRLERRGLDPLLDHPETPRRILERDGVEVLPPGLVLYVVIRRALLDMSLESRTLADYVAALVLEFGHGDRAHRISLHDDEEYRYLVDILDELTRTSGRRAFFLQTHLGNFALWLSGLFPGFIEARVRRKGGPGLDYYEEMGQTGYRMAADAPLAEERSLDDLFRDTAAEFPRVRRALNQVSDRLLFPRASSPVDRLLRQVRDDYLGDDDPGPA